MTALARRALWSRTPLFALGGLAAISVVVLLYANRSIGFHYDEWDFLQHRRGWTADALLQPNMEHLQLVPALIYKVLFELFGATSHLPYQLALLAMHVSCAVLLYVFGRARVGPWAALAPPALVLLLGSAWQDLLWPFQIGFVGSVTFGLAAFIALDHERDALATLLLGLSIACTGVGLCVAAGVGVRLALQAPRRLGVVVLPVALWGMWALAYGGTSLTEDALLKTPVWAVDAAAYAAAGLGGLGVETGRLLLAAIAVAFFVGLRRAGTQWALLLGVAAVPVSFWLLTGGSRALITTPDTSRYVYVGAVWLLVILLQAFSGTRPTRGHLVAGALVCLFAIAGNLGPLRDAARSLRQTTQTVMATLTAVEIARDHVAPDVQPTPVLAPQIRVGSYLAAAEDLGSPAFSEQEMSGESSALRVEADTTLVRLLSLSVASPAPEESGGAAPPQPDAPPAPPMADGKACWRTFGSVPGPWEFRLPPGGGIRVSASPSFEVEVKIRRFADPGAGPVVGSIPGGGSGVISVPRDRSQRTWVLGVSSSHDIKVCSA